ncbi:hypothetical protein MMC29_006877, partial [Sticta canariensis]|nr:hypothetical protein [Sticta canariensis]
DLQPFRVVHCARFRRLLEGSSSATSYVPNAFLLPKFDPEAGVRYSIGSRESLPARPELLKCTRDAPQRDGRSRWRSSSQKPYQIAKGLQNV